jgi:hypothetical protein
MHIHRIRHASNFTVMPNVLLQDRRLSYTARGLLADLLSRPDGWREDGRHMADTSPQGRIAVAKALKELARAGYYRVVKIRQPDGTLLSESHVYDTPQLAAAPAARSAGPGESPVGAGDAPPEKDRGEEPTLPRQRDTSAELAPGVREAVAALFRVIRPEPRLRLGPAEAVALAPLVRTWLDRVGERELAAALLPGLPEVIHRPSALLRTRLERKLPPATPPVARPSRHECARCADPVPKAGICRACAGLTPSDITVGPGAAVTARGMARIRAALRGDLPAGLGTT